jgi:hypothetical protein
LAENLDRQHKEKTELAKVQMETSMSNAQAEQEIKFIAEQDRKKNANMEFHALQHASFKQRQLKKAEDSVLENQEKRAKLLEMIQKKADYDIELQNKKSNTQAAMQNIHSYRQTQIVRLRAFENCPADLIFRRANVLRKPPKRKLQHRLTTIT